ncbi:MFS transporter [Jannaschia sp. CCS1]|uniref:MFS transporter n=1 Tax=Jannaschia sp. (strain CCS1) TaxID=290400 RepID=UPI00006BFF7A|nr:MFS transporter [Jannaschia sp. CCS1]ABD53336.1 major facilitator superfamily MFS_1 [Jannaschia sp. CCS1]
MPALIRENRNFRLLMSGAGVSNLSDGIGALAFPWMATLITTDPRALAIVAFATRLPWFLWSLPVGVWTDRADRQKMMVRADLARMALAMAVVALIVAGPRDGGQVAWMIGGLAALAFLMGTAEVFRDNAAQTALPSVVPKDRLEEANGQIWSVEQVMGQFIGPPLAGFLIAVAAPAPFLFEALGFALAAFAVWAIAFPARGALVPRRGFWTEMNAGWTWIREHKVILQLALILGGLNAAHMAGFTILVLFSQEVLGLGAVGHGMLLTAGAAGGVAGGLLCPWVAKRLGASRSLWVALALMPLPFLGLYFTSQVWVAVVLLFLETFVAVLWNVVTVSFRQRVIPDALLGRVNSIYRFFGWGMMPLGALAGGWIMALAEPSMGREDALRLVFLLCAGLFAALFLYGLARLRLPKGAAG